MRVLVVDDSIVFRSSISAALKGIPGIEVVGAVSNGKIALDKLQQESVDLVTLDMEMPEMDGLQTLRAMKERGLTQKVIVFSSQTTRGAERALSALAAGASDVVAKPENSIGSFESAEKAIASVLIPKVLQFVANGRRIKDGLAILSPSENRGLPLATVRRLDPHRFPREIIVIASSTGGPSALEAIFKALPKKLDVPVLIAQHMPPVFTQILAKRLSEISGLSVAEAKQGELLRPGDVRIAPGDFHLSVAKNSEGLICKLDQGPQRNSVRPAADFLFESAAANWGDRVLGIVLTGMGEDGLVGARAIKKALGCVVIQDKVSCVVFGMPGAVASDGLQDAELSLDDIAKVIRGPERARGAA